MNRLRELRKKQGLSQLELGKALSMSQNTISQYETGNRKMDPETLSRFSTFFDISIDYLLGVEIKKTPTPVSEDGLDVEQMELVRLYDAASPALRAAALAVLKSAEEQDKAQGKDAASE